MEIVARLKSAYGADQPILLEEVKAVMSDYSTPHVFRFIKSAIESEELIRYDESVYYIPTTSFLGRSSLNPRKVMEKKYINREGKTIGFYSGIGLLNAIGGTRQMPFAQEIVTNAERSRVREVPLGKSRVILRRPRCEITCDNKVILQVLELCNKYIWDEEAKEAIAAFAKGNGITMRDLMAYAKYYPAKAIKNASEVLYDIA